MEAAPVPDHLPFVTQRRRDSARRTTKAVLLHWVAASAISGNVEVRCSSSWIEMFHPPKRRTLEEDRATPYRQPEPSLCPRATPVVIVVSATSMQRSRQGMIAIPSGVDENRNAERDHFVGNVSGHAAPRILSPPRLQLVQIYRYVAHKSIFRGRDLSAGAEQERGAYAQGRT